MRHLPLMPDLGSFPAGVRISTTAGELPVEEIAPGMRLITPDGENVTVTATARRSVRFAPRTNWGKLVRVPAGALGGGLPARDLVLPPGQLVGVADLSPVDLFGRADVLMPASALRVLPGARLMKGRRKMEVHAVFTAEPQLIYAEGAVTETTRPILSRIVATLTGGLLGGRRHRRAALRVISAREGRRLIARLRKNGDLPDRPPGKRENDLLQWDLDLASERSTAERLDKKAS